MAKLVFAVLVILFSIETKGSLVNLAIQNGNASAFLTALCREKPVVELIYNCLSIGATIAFVSGVIWAFLHIEWYLVILILPIAPFLFGMIGFFNPNAWSRVYPAIACKLRGFLSLLVILITLYLWNM